MEPLPQHLQQIDLIQILEWEVLQMPSRNGQVLP